MESGHFMGKTQTQLFSFSFVSLSNQMSRPRSCILVRRWGLWGRICCITLSWYFKTIVEEALLEGPWEGSRTGKNPYSFFTNPPRDVTLPSSISWNSLYCSFYLSFRSQPGSGSHHDLCIFSEPKQNILMVEQRESLL